MKVFVLTKEYCLSAIAAVLAVTAVIVLGIATAGTPVFKSGAEGWGLGFGSGGGRPSGTLSAEKLAQYDAYYVGNADDKCIYLTFDAGFEAGYTPKILDTLKEKGVKCAFFLVGNVFDSEPDLVKRMAEEGHVVGNHTLSHPDMTEISEEEITKQLTTVEEKYRTVTGTDMLKFFRPPEGRFNEKLLTSAKAAGYKTVFWSLAYVDWEKTQKSKEFAFSKLMPRLHNGCILLLHSTSETNSEILGEFIDRCRAEGYTFKSLTELP